MENISEAKKAAGAAGGAARALRLSAEKRSEIAQRAADARWGKDIQQAEYPGKLIIAGQELECAVLQDGRRIIAQKSIMETLERSPSSGRRTRNDNRPPFIEAGNLQPYIKPELREKLGRIEYRLPGAKGSKFGYSAEILPEVCELYLLAQDDGVLLANQLPAAAAAQRLVRALAKIGIVALVDEATGYQDRRAKDELQKLLEQYVDEEFRPWVSRFPETFFKQVYRLHEWDFKPGNHQHPSYVGKFIKEYVYDSLPEGVTERLQEVNPITTAGGSRSRKHHQHIPAGAAGEHLDRVITSVTTLMKVSNSKGEFVELFQRMDTGRPQQGVLELKS